MRKVWKYPLSWDDVTTVNLPQGARLLDVRPQGDDLALWALVKPDAPLVPRQVRIAGTGHPIEGVVDHISTFQMHGGALVFHAFELDPMLMMEPDDA